MAAHADAPQDRATAFGALRERAATPAVRILAAGAPFDCKDQLRSRGYHWMSGVIRMTPSSSGRGFTLAIAPAWDRTGSAAERLWSAPDARALGAASEFEADSRIAIDAGYGFRVPGTGAARSVRRRERRSRKPCIMSPNREPSKSTSIVPRLPW